MQRSDGMIVSPDEGRDLSAAARTWALSVTGFCTFLGMYATQALLPSFQHSFGISESQSALTVSASSLSVALVAPLAGFFAGRLGRKRVIVTSLLGLAAATVLVAAATSFHGLLAWRFLQGIFVALIYVIASTYINEEWRDGGAGAAMSAFISGNVLGGFAGRFLCGLLTEHVGWRTAFVLLGGVTVLGALAAWSLLPPARQAGSRNRAGDGRQVARVLASPALLGTNAVGFGLLFVQVGVFSTVTFRLADAPFGLGPAALGSIFAVYLFGMVVTPIAGRWIDRVGNRTVGILAMAAALVGLLLTLLPSLAAIATGLALVAASTFIGQAAASSFVGRVAGSYKAEAAGLYIACYYAGGSVGAALLGRLWETYGWAGCVAVVAVAQLLMIAIMGRWWRTAQPVLVAT